MDREMDAIMNFREENKPLVDATREAIAHIEKLPLGKEEKYGLNNIGIIMNNKLMELVNMFHNADLDFFDNSIISTAILNHLYSLLVQGGSAINTYLYKVSSITVYRDSKQLNSLLSDYKESCDLIFAYDIRRNLVQTMASYVSEVARNYEFAVMITDNYEVLCEEIEDELTALGLDELITPTLAEIDMVYVKIDAALKIARAKANDYNNNRSNK